MTEPLFAKSAVREAFEALRRDLIHEDGPRISTMRNYRFAIVQYLPEQELALHDEVRRLSSDLVAHGWVVLPLDLRKLLLDRVRSEGEGWLARVLEMERRAAAIAPERGLNYLTTKLTPLIEGPDGIAADVSRVIAEHVERHPGDVDRTLALIGRAGALYPFFRSSALLRHLDRRATKLTSYVIALL